MELANGPPDLSKIRHSQYVNSRQLARRLGHFAAWGMNATATATATATASATATATATAAATAATAT